MQTKILILLALVIACFDSDALYINIIIGVIVITLLMLGKKSGKAIEAKETYD